MKNGERRKRAWQIPIPAEAGKALLELRARVFAAKERQADVLAVHVAALERTRIALAGEVIDASKALLGRIQSAASESAADGPGWEIDFMTMRFIMTAGGDK